MSLLELRDLSVRFHTEDGDLPAVDRCSLSVNEGETVAIVGESGSGKSALANAIMGLHGMSSHATVSGDMLFDGSNLMAFSEAEWSMRRGNAMSMVFQEPMTAFNPVMTLGDQLTEAVFLHNRVDGSVARERAAMMLKKVAIHDPSRLMASYPHELSGGMRQRAMLAMALINHPKLLIADEPTTALDVTVQAQVLSLLDQLKAEYHLTVLLITHDLGIAFGRADRIVVMYAGQIVEDRPAPDFFASPAHPYSEALLKSIPPLTKQSEPLEAIPGSVPVMTRLPSGCRFADRCSSAQPRCREAIPSLDPTGDHGRVRCYYPRQGGGALCG